MSHEIKTLTSSQEVRHTLGWAAVPSVEFEDAEEFKQVRYFAIPHEHENGSSIVADDNDCYMFYDRVTEDNQIETWYIRTRPARCPTIEHLAGLNEAEVYALFRELGKKGDS